MFDLAGGSAGHDLANGRLLVVYGYGYTEFLETEYLRR